MLAIVEVNNRDSTRLTGFAPGSGEQEHGRADNFTQNSAAAFAIQKNVDAVEGAEYDFG